MLADWDGHPGAGAWTGFVEAGLDTSTIATLVPADIDVFCAGYGVASAAGRRQFWMMLISAIAKEESDFDPDSVFEEPPPLNQKSLGLMQLSLTDTRYGCDFPDEAAVLDPRRNLICAVRIMDRLVARDGRIGGDPPHRTAGGAAYWSTLRAPRPGKRDARGYVISRTRALALA